MDVTKQTFHLSKLIIYIHLHRLFEFGMSFIFQDKLIPNKVRFKKSFSKAMHLKTKNLEPQLFAHKNKLKELSQLLA
jgi:hypothetical protein